MNPTKPLLLAIALAACAPGHANGPQATQATQAATANAPVPLLWKVSDADNSLYLLGSFHMLKAEDYPLSSDIYAAFDDAESLLFEIEPSVLNTPETVAKFQAATGYDDGSTLSQVLPAGTRAKLEKLLAASGGSLDKVERSEPWAVNLGLLLGVSQAMGFRQEHGLDRHFMNRAEEAGKPVSGLEGIDAQLAALDGVPRAEQVAELDEFLTDPSKAIAEFRLLHATWRFGDAGLLDRKFRQEMASKTPAAYKLVNVDRNNAWMPEIEKRLVDVASDDTLIIVGALHLLGSDGLVEKLRRKGYRIERVCSEACIASLQGEVRHWIDEKKTVEKQRSPESSFAESFLRGVAEGMANAAAGPARHHPDHVTEQMMRDAVKDGIEDEIRHQRFLDELRSN